MALDPARLEEMRAEAEIALREGPVSLGRHILDLLAEVHRLSVDLEYTDVRYRDAEARCEDLRAALRRVAGSGA